MNHHLKSWTCGAALAAGLLAGGCSKAPEVTATAPAAVPAAVQAASTAAGQVSDIDVTEHVKTALMQNESLKGFDIQVVTLNGDVRLIGMLENQVQVDEAIKIARASDGAHTIHDELTLKK